MATYSTSVPSGQGPSRGVPKTAWSEELFRVGGLLGHDYPPTSSDALTTARFALTMLLPVKANQQSKFLNVRMSLLRWPLCGSNVRLPL